MQADLNAPSKSPNSRVPSTFPDSHLQGSSPRPPLPGRTRTPSGTCAPLRDPRHSASASLRRHAHSHRLVASGTARPASSHSLAFLGLRASNALSSSQTDCCEQPFSQSPSPAHSSVALRRSPPNSCHWQCQSQPLTSRLFRFPSPRSSHRPERGGRTDSSPSQA
jgi:hypothetical protein